MRAQRRATLIQNVRLLKDCIEPLIVSLMMNDPALRRLPLRFLNSERMLLWIIEEELELCYGLFSTSHVHNEDPETHVHNHLDKFVFQEFGITLSRLFTQHIKGPYVFDNNVVKVKLQGDDLFIIYYTDAPIAVLGQRSFLG